MTLVASEAPPKKRRRWRWGLYALFAVAVILSFLFFLANSELNRAIAETDALDPGWRLEEIEAARAVIPDSENSALVIQKGIALIRNQKQIDALNLDDYRDHPEWRLRPDELAQAQAILAANPEALAEFRKLSNMPRGRFPLTITPNPTNALPAASMTARKPLDLQRLDLYDRLEANDVPGAVDRLLAGLNVGRSIGDEPFLISLLIRIAIDISSVGRIERFLAQCETDDATLAKLQHELELLETEPIALWGLRGERGWGFGQFEYLKWHPGSSPAAMTNTWRDYLFYLPGGANHDEADYLRYMNQIIGIIHQPTETWCDATDDLERATQKMSLLAKPKNVPIVMRVSARRNAFVSAMIAALAAERYRIKFNKWPETLDDLVKNKLLAKIPLDPFDGKPLRWKTVSGGRIVYFIGVDRVDNKGDLIGSSNPVFTRDDGCRLFDPDNRRQTPPPKLPKAETNITETTFEP
ncbi:MAG: hypothetical protein ACJ8C4_10240 [Gemmataceae bacterium]